MTKHGGFWDKVLISTDDECWLWSAGIQHGYGIFRSQKAHRVAYIMTYGSIKNGLDVLHKCHNKLCCNPKHLELGTHTNNMRDTDRTPFVQEDIDYIKDAYAKKLYNQRELADMYTVDPSTISHIIRGTRWN